MTNANVEQVEQFAVEKLQGQMLTLCGVASARGYERINRFTIFIDIPKDLQEFCPA